MNMDEVLALAEKGYQVSRYLYEKGVEYIVGYSGRQVSVCCTNGGTWDVKVLTQFRPLYTGRDGKQAAEACAKYLNGGEYVG